MRAPSQTLGARAKARSPKPQAREGQYAYPDRYIDTPCRQFYPEQDAKQLREGDQPEEDRGYKRRWLLHLNARGSRERASHHDIGGNLKRARADVNGCVLIEMPTDRESAPPRERPRLQAVNRVRRRGWSSSPPVSLGKVRPRERASFPLIGHVARLTRLGQSRPTRRTVNLWTIGVWHPHCVPARMRLTEEGTAMAKIMGALITAIFVAAALLEWVAMRM